MCPADDTIALPMGHLLRHLSAPARLLAAVFWFCLVGAAAELSPEPVARIERVIYSEMAETAAGESFLEYLRRRVFESAGLVFGRFRRC